MGALYEEITLSELVIKDGRVTFNGKSYVQSKNFGESLSYIVNTPPNIDALDKRVVFYHAVDKAVAVFPLGVSLFKPDDALTLRNRLRAEGWHLPEQHTEADKTWAMVFNPETVETVIGPIRVGMFLDIPHDAVRPAMFYSVVERVSNRSYFVLPDKGSTLKTDFSMVEDPLDWMYESVKSSVKHVGETLTAWLVKRLKQLHGVTASLEECLKVCEKTNGMVERVLDMDTVMTKHGLAAPSDKWTMFRRQANTPYNRLTLALLMSEYATYGADMGSKFSLMAEAGSMILDRGDLESRPVWVSWDKTVARDILGNEYLFSGGEIQNK